MYIHIQSNFWLVRSANWLRHKSRGAPSRGEWGELSKARVDGRSASARRRRSRNPRWARAKTTPIRGIWGLSDGRWAPSTSYSKRFGISFGAFCHLLTQNKGWLYNDLMDFLIFSFYYVAGGRRADGTGTVLLPNGRRLAPPHMDTLNTNELTFNLFLPY